MTPSAPLPPPARARGGRFAWAYAASAGIALLGLFDGFHADLGTSQVGDFTAVAHRWPWELPSPLRWSRDAGWQAVLWVGVLVPLVAAFLRAGPRRGFVAALGAGLCLSVHYALDWGQAPDPTFLYAVEAFAPAVLGACVAAGLVSAREGGRGRGLATAAAIALLALLLYPLGVDPAPGAEPMDLGYVSPVTGLLASIQHPTGQAFVTHPWSAGVIFSLVVASTGILSAVLAPRRWMGIVAFAGFLGIALYAAGWTALDVFREASKYLPQRGRLEALAIAVGNVERTVGTAALLGIYAGAREMLRRE